MKSLISLHFKNNKQKTNSTSYKDRQVLLLWFQFAEFVRYSNFAAADLEQANDVNLTKESEEIEKERLREDSETNDEKVEELNNEAESTDGPKMRIRKAMKEKYSNLD